MPIRVWSEETEVHVKCSSPEVLRDVVDGLLGRERRYELPHSDRIDVSQLLGDGGEERVQFDAEGHRKTGVFLLQFFQF